MTSKRGCGLPPHQLWISYLFFLVSLMAYNTWGCVTQGNGTDFHLRLHAGKSSNSGIVQYKNAGTWHRVCTIGWQAKDGEAFCRSLGYLSFVGFNENFTQAPDASEIMYRTFVHCTGNEDCLAQCEGHQWMVVPRQGPSGVSECYLTPSKAVICSYDPPVTPTISHKKAAAAFAIAENLMTTPSQMQPKAAKAKFASLQVAPTTTLSPLQHVTSSTLFASTQTTPKTPSTAGSGSSTVSAQPTTTPTLSTLAMNTTTPTTGPSTTPTERSTTTNSSRANTEGNGAQTSPSTQPPTPSTLSPITTTRIPTTTRPSFSTPSTSGSTSQSTAMTTPTTRAPEGSTGRAPLGVSSYGDNKECPNFSSTYTGSEKSGKITSPGYPQNYPTNIRCRWLVRVEAGKLVRFDFLDFKIQQYDFVKIYENDPSGNVVATLSGDIADPNRIPVSNTTRRKRATQNHAYTVNSDQALVEFYSDDAHVDRGFASNYEEANPSSGASTDQGNNNWIIILVIMLLLLLLIILLILLYCWWKQKKEKENKDEKQLLYSKDGKMTVDPKSDYNAVAKSVESLFCVEGENDKAKLIDGYRDTIVVFDNPSYRSKNRSGSTASLEQKSDEIKQQMANSGGQGTLSRPGSGLRATPRPFVKDGVVMMLPKTNNYTPDESEPFTRPASSFVESTPPDETPRKKKLLSKDSKVAPLDASGSNVKSTITMNPRSEASTDPEGVICANNKYSIVATVDGKKFGELDPVGSVPPDFLCPITNKLMKNPVSASDGKSYERKAIVAWLAKKQTSPVTDEPMSEESLKPNAALKSRIKQWKKQKENTKDRADREANISHTSAIGDIDC